jgi:hypothetical protein
MTADIEITTGAETGTTTTTADRVSATVSSDRRTHSGY